jgi:O-antigen ligase
MRFANLIQIFKERMAEANVPLLLAIAFVGLIIAVFVLWRWGAGVLMAMPIILIGLQITRSNVLNGISVMGKYVLAVVLVIFALFGRKNKRPFSLVAGLLLLFPAVMLLNSLRAIDVAESFGTSVIFLLFYIGLVVGGRKILGDARGRATFTKTLALFSIIIACVQLPFLKESQGRFAGVFENLVGLMTVGMVGTIILFWFGMKQKFGSVSFVFFMSFAALTLFFLILNGGRTALGGSALGILTILSRKLKRNVVVFLALAVILIPVGVKIIPSIPAFEAAKSKIFSERSSGRAGQYALAWNEIKAKPIMGWGTGAAYFKAYTTTGMEYHQSYLEIAVDHGILFALLMMVLFAWLPFRGLYLMPECPTEEMKNMVNLSSAFLSAYVFASFLGGVLNITTGILPVYTVIALQEGVYAENREIKTYGLYDEYDENGLLYDESEEMLQGETT